MDRHAVPLKSVPGEPVVPALARPWDGRWLTAGMVAGYFAALFAIALILGVDIGGVWNAIGVSALPQHFQDLRDIATGIDRFETADHPWSAETIAYSVEAFSYPKWWLGAAFLGLNLDSVYFFGIGFVILYVVCVMLVLGRISLLEGFVAGLMIVSPAVMTGIERGNGDLIIFAFLTLALVQRQILPLSMAGILVAAFLKLYPAAALAAWIRPPWRRTLPWVAGALLLFGLDLWTSSRELPQIAHGILHMQWFSFGSTPILIGLHWVVPEIFDYAHILALGTFFYVAVLGISVWRRPPVSSGPDWDRPVFAFRIGAAIFIGTFALGTNYDYRTMMLVFCLPLLFALIRERGAGYKWALAATVMIPVYMNWYCVFPDTYGTGLQFFIKQLVGWGILACLAAIVAGTYGTTARKTAPLPVG